MLVLPGHDTREMSLWSPRPKPKAEMTLSMAPVPIEYEMLGLSRILRQKGPVCHAEIAGWP